MKKIFKYVPIILGLVMLMSSCGDDDETAPAAVLAPTLSISINSTQIASGDVINVETGTSVTLSITANRVGSGKDLDVMSITQSGLNTVSPFIIQAGASDPYNFAGGTEVSLKNDDDETFFGTGIFTNITASAGSTAYTITVKDKDGNTTAVRFSIAVTNPTTPLQNNKSGYFYHIAGSETGAWNISSDTTVSSGSMQTGTVLTNTNIAGNAFTGAFSLSSGSTMVVGTAGDFDNATVESAEAVYNGGAAVTANTAPAVGDVYIVKMENGNYVALKVIALDPNDTTSPNNKGKISFDYKK